MSDQRTDFDTEAEPQVELACLPDHVFGRILCQISS
jgi:hypothetical protein